MAIFCVKKSTNYTVMSNQHLRDKSLSLKAKGLLSQILSLPEEWDFTLLGLAYINQEQLDAIRQAVHELERAGYIVRTRERDSRGLLCGTLSADCIRLLPYLVVWFGLQQPHHITKRRNRA